MKRKDSDSDALLLFNHIVLQNVSKCNKQMRLMFRNRTKITKQRVERGSKNRYYMISSKRCSKIKHKNNNITKER